MTVTQFNPSGLQRTKPRRETTKQRNERRKAAKRVKAARAATAIIEADAATKHEAHLKGGIMRDLERMYGKRYTRASSSMAYILEELAVFSYRTR